MKRRLALALAFAVVTFLQAAATPVAAQPPVPAQASPRTVRAAIPPQAEPATAPAAASVPSLARPATAPTPAVAAQPAPAVAPVAASTPQAVTTPVPPQARPAPVPQAKPEVAPGPRSPSEYEAANVKLEVTIAYQVGTGKPVYRTASLTVADQGRGSLRSGTQVAVPSTTFMPAGTGGPATQPMTSYSYKSVGLNVDANRVYLQGNKARIDLNVEFSAVDEKPGAAGVGGSYPLFPTFSQNLTLVLESGKEVVVGQSSDVVENQERKQTVTVKATILR
jgi:cytoskeletal protein RodZ